MHRPRLLCQKRGSICEIKVKIVDIAAFSWYTLI